VGKRSAATFAPAPTQEEAHTPRPTTAVNTPPSVSDAPPVSQQPTHITPDSVHQPRRSTRASSKRLVYDASTGKHVLPVSK
jgi:hypothetical protein